MALSFSLPLQGGTETGFSGSLMFPDRVLPVIPISIVPFVSLAVLAAGSLVPASAVVRSVMIGAIGGVAIVWAGMFGQLVLEGLTLSMTVYGGLLGCVVLIVGTRKAFRELRDVPTDE